MGLPGSGIVAGKGTVKAPGLSGALGSEDEEQCPVRDSNSPHRIKSPALYQMS
jgi:hypothetical protein